MAKKKSKEKMPIGLMVTRCYKCSDGGVFEDFSEAKEHQNRLDFCEALDEHIDDYVRVAGCRLEQDEKALLTDAIMGCLDEWEGLFLSYRNARG